MKKPARKKELAPEEKTERQRERVAEKFNEITERGGTVRVKVKKDSSSFTRMVARVVDLGDAGWHAQVHNEEKDVYQYKRMGPGWWAGVERIVELMGGA